MRKVGFELKKTPFSLNLSLYFQSCLFNWLRHQCHTWYDVSNVAIWTTKQEVRIKIGSSLLKQPCQRETENTNQLLLTVCKWTVLKKNKQIEIRKKEKKKRHSTLTFSQMEHFSVSSNIWNTYGYEAHIKWVCIFIMWKNMHQPIKWKKLSF